MEIIKTAKAVAMGGGSLLCEYSRFRIFKDPLVLNAEITGLCPLNCPFCYFKAGWKCGNKKDLSAEKWKEIFLYHKRKGVKTLVITGGEPAFRPDVLQIAFEIFGRDLVIITNGLGMPIPKNIKCRIFLSIDGTVETQDKWRRGKNIVKTVFENYRNDKRAMVSMTVMPFNADEIEEVYKLSREMNIYGITFSFYTPPKIDKQEDPFLLEGKELERAVGKIRELMRKDKKFVFMSEQILRSFIKKRHYRGCSLKAGWVLSLNPAGEKKYPCVIGENPNCKKCGCIIPHIMAALIQEAIYMFLTLGTESIKDTVDTAFMFALQKDYDPVATR